MSKFKVGDKVRCVKHSAAIGVRVGNIYTVRGYNNHCNKFGCVLLVEVNSSPFESCLELVEPNPVLTPEEVFQHLRNGTKLQYKQEASPTGWRDCSNPQFANILNRVWRIKPEPEVIELNGKKYREIVE